MKQRKFEPVYCPKDRDIVEDLQHFVGGSSIAARAMQEILDLRSALRDIRKITEAVK